MSDVTTYAYYPTNDPDTQGLTTTSVTRSVTVNAAYTHRTDLPCSAQIPRLGGIG